jgi:hypothetical protein
MFSVYMGSRTEREGVKLYHKIPSTGELQALSVGKAAARGSFLTQPHSKNTNLPSCLLSSHTPPALNLAVKNRNIIYQMQLV